MMMITFGSFLPDASDDDDADAAAAAAADDDCEKMIITSIL